MTKIIITPNAVIRNGPSSLSGFSLLDIVLCAFTNRDILLTLVRRDIEVRYRGSVLGMAWLVAVPLIMLAAYTFVFSVVFKSRWADGNLGTAGASLIMYAGLIMYNLFSEPVSRAPSLITENVSYVKKVVFPLRILPWVTILTSAMGTVVSTALLFVFYLLFVGRPPLSALFLPVTFMPVALLGLGTSWLLASAGTYVRDIKHLAGLATSFLMFLSPVLYPVASLPEKIRPLIYLNPLTPSLEAMRSVLFQGSLPSMTTWGVYALCCWLYAAGGYAVFKRLERGFADVV